MGKALWFGSWPNLFGLDHGLGFAIHTLLQVLHLPWKSLSQHSTPINPFSTKVHQLPDNNVVYTTTFVAWGWAVAVAQAISPFGVNLQLMTDVRTDVQTDGRMGG